jgi:hypothetical protein
MSCFSPYRYVEGNSTKLCRTCEMELPIRNFYKSKSNQGGYHYSCRLCMSEDRRIRRREQKGSNLSYVRNKSDIYLGHTTQKDFNDMYDFLSKIGYNIEGDIHQQFLDKYNSRFKRPIEYKERNKWDQNLFLSNGQKNPDYISK